MNTLTHIEKSETPGVSPGESLRREIVAPENYVSVFHETTTDALASIEKHGLLADHDEDKNIGGHLFVMKVNRLIDEDRPDFFREAGVSRSEAIFAYPSLYKGYGIGKASKQFALQTIEQLRDRYDSITSIMGATAFKDLAVETFDDYVFLNTDPDLLKEQHPGEVLQMKVDPSKCYVSDISRYSDIAMNIKEGTYHPGFAEEWYWGSLITLESFRRFYRLAEQDEHGEIRRRELFGNGQYLRPNVYYPLANAPDNMPYEIDDPEILIPTNIPPEHIQLLNNANPLYRSR